MYRILSKKGFTGNSETKYVQIPLYPLYNVCTNKEHTTRETDDIKENVTSN